MLEGLVSPEPQKFHLLQVKATVEYVVGQDLVFAKPATLETKESSFEKVLKFPLTSRPLRLLLYCEYDEARRPAFSLHSVCISVLCRHAAVPCLHARATHDGKV